jgi:hypothetical protein
MEFIDGARLTDPAALAARGVSRPGLARLVAETFNEMIFIHGDVHCDPHAANMVRAGGAPTRRHGSRRGGRGRGHSCYTAAAPWLTLQPTPLPLPPPSLPNPSHPPPRQLVRKAPDGRDQLVLLDHGLYRVIDDDFRLRYAQLWRALVFADAEGIKEHATAMNAGDLYALFAAMLTQRPWEQVRGRAPARDCCPVDAAAREPQCVRSAGIQAACPCPPSPPLPTPRPSPPPPRALPRPADRGQAHRPPGAAQDRQGQADAAGIRPGAAGRRAAGRCPAPAPRCVKLRASACPLSMSCPWPCPHPPASPPPPRCM